MLRPPTAARRPHVVDSPHGVRIDDYYWLRDDTRQDADVLAYLQAENSYTREVLAPHKALEESIYQEIVARIPQEDDSVPVLDRGYWYRTRFQTGQQYPLYLRRADGPGNPEELLLDCNQLAQGHEFFQLASYEVSDDNALLAYTEDVVGRRQYRIRIKNLATGELLPDMIENADPGFAWTGDRGAHGGTLLYVVKDPVTLRAARVYAHRLGTPVSDDVLIYEETAEDFSVDVARSKSYAYLYLASESTLSSEWRLIDAFDPALKTRIFLPRSPEHEYQIEHVGPRWFMRTNRGAKNFRIVELPSIPAGPEDAANPISWRDVVAHDEHNYLHEFDVFQDFIAVSERSGGLRKLRIQPLEGAAAFHIEAAEAAYTTLLGSNPQLQTQLLRYTYTSLTTPATTYDYDTRTRTQTLLKRERVPGDFAAERYRTEFLCATAADGERIPISVVYRIDAPGQLATAAGVSDRPLYLYGYGAYGHCVDPTFSSARLSLLDRGIVFAIAHVRGGQELGRRWYDDGRLLRKENTFTDFVATADFLVAQGYAAADRLLAAGGSAGGLLIGAVANLAAHKFRALVAHVPFVDIVTTMLDESIPLTTLEYDEWGNPAEKTYYDYMLSYSPYDNVQARDYPAMLVTTGLWDSQVQYYEPAKWVAKLRTLKTDRHNLLLHTEMEAGHGGQSGRFRRQRDTAREYAFLLSELALPNTISENT
jgi:oligopeptidase B